MSFFQNLLSSIMERSLLKSSYFRSKDFGILHEDINKALESVMSKSGEISSLVFAEHLSSLIEALNDEEFIEFFETLHAKYDLDAEALLRASNEYSKNKTQKNLELIFQASEPQWVKLFKRLNTVSEGTLRLVRLRERIRSLKQASPSLEFFDRSLLKLFKHWFNPSFLVLESIDWSTPANILEKIIAYEAVHEINSWDDLRARLAPDDRKCFAFFHPLMPNEPLIFVEVALSNKIPNTINEIITIDRSVTLNQDINTAVFYSISNCQEGLSGISFGNFLIKQVANDLNLEFKNLKKFVTLSPVPGLRKWISDKHPKFAKSLERLKRPEQFLKVHDNMMEYVGKYFLSSERTDKMPNDPVARFHLGNGASLEQINYLGDLSSNGIKLSAGLMVNYLYDLDKVEKNHELYTSEKKINISKNAKKVLLKYTKETL